LLSRDPTREELTDARTFLTSQPDSTRWPTFIQSLMASAEYRYVW